MVTYTDEQRKTATLYDSSKLKGKDKYAVFFGGNFSVMNIRTTVINIPIIIPGIYNDNLPVIWYKKGNG